MSIKNLFIQQFANYKAVTVHTDDKIILFSYGKKVAVFRRGEDCWELYGLCTDEWAWSTTTARHLNEALVSLGLPEMNAHQRRAFKSRGNFKG